MATLSENMDAATITDASFTLNNGATGAVTYSGTTVTLTPANNLLASTLYTATITTAAKDIVGNALAAPYTWTFTTGTLPDTTAPTVASTTPANNAENVSVKVIPGAVFSEVMTAASINPASFSLNNNASGTVNFSNNTATYTPNPQLNYATTYTATIASSAKDVAGNVMVAPHTWSFTTRVAPINDTGIASNYCYAASVDPVIADMWVGCNDPAAIALSPAQDGMVGRDANLATNSNSYGKLGFSFTPVAGVCVLDNVTGLMWEVKTKDVTPGLRDWTKKYTNYDSTSELQKGISLPPPTQDEINASTNSIGFRNEVNAIKLCGFDDWRLPTILELLSIMDYGVGYSSTTVDSGWFPNTQGSYYWSSSPYVGYAVFAWNINFLNGTVRGIGPPSWVRNSSNYVRLVRAGY